MQRSKYRDTPNPNIHTSKWPDIQISRYPNIQVFIYPHIQISRYPDIQISRYPDIQNSQSGSHWDNLCLSPVAVGATNNGWEGENSGRTEAGGRKNNWRYGRLDDPNSIALAAAWLQVGSIWTAPAGELNRAPIKLHEPHFISLYSAS